MEGKVPEEAIVDILAGIITSLSMTVAMMEQMIGPPVFLEAGTPRARFRYVDPTAKTLQILKCVRVASALHAALTLLINGQTIEAGVLFRTIDDAIGDFHFVDEVIDTGQANAAQQRYIEDYFKDDVSINDNERRQKVQASEARFYGQGNPSDAKKTVKTIDNTFSGIVHGGYASIMDMYGGNPPHFHTDGVPVRFSEYRHHLGLYVHRALNIFCKMAYNLGHHEMAHYLRELRRTFEASPAYTQQ